MVMVDEKQVHELETKAKSVGISKIAGFLNKSYNTIYASLHRGPMRYKNFLAIHNAIKAIKQGNSCSDGLSRPNINATIIHHHRDGSKHTETVNASIVEIKGKRVVLEIDGIQHKYNSTSLKRFDFIH